MLLWEKKGGHKMKEIGNGLYELTPGINEQYLIKSQLVASQKMELFETETGGYYIIKTVDKSKNIRKLYYPLSYGLAMSTYNNKILVTSEKIIFKENGEVQIHHTHNANTNLTKVISYRSDGSVYKREAIFRINQKQKNFHLEENGKIYDEKGNIVLETLPNGFEKQSYIDALTANSKFKCAEFKNEESKKSSLR